MPPATNVYAIDVCLVEIGDANIETVVSYGPFPSFLIEHRRLLK